MIASLPMYWRAENAQAWRALWADVQECGRSRGLDLPELTPPEDIPEPWTGHWLRDDLILSQTCSMPLRTALRHRVTYVGTFDFGLDGPAGHYHSEFLTHRPHHRPHGPVRALAVNGTDSQSGYVAGFEPLLDGGPETAYAGHARTPHLTGSHAASLRRVAEGQADACYLDAVTYRLCRTYDPWAGTPCHAGRTRSTPGLPLITAAGRDPAPLRAALRDVFASEPAWLGDPALGGLRGFVVLDPDAYLSLPVPPPVLRWPVP